MRYDAIIVGQGLAGSTMAWALLARGASVLVVDRETANTASGVAAGLVTPVTGKTISQPAHYQRDYAAARAHYKSVERATNQRFWTERPALRLFPTDEDASRLATRRAGLGSELAPVLPAPAHGFQPFADAALMTSAARLDVPRYVDAVRLLLKTRQCYIQHLVEPGDIKPDAAGVRIDGLDAHARCVVLCGGSLDANNPWLADYTLNPAKGEILTVAIEDFAEQRTTHRGMHWLLPTDDPGVYRFGATYDHDDMTSAPTAAARATLETALSILIDRPYRVLDQQAGLRPVGPQRRLVVGAHPAHAAVVLFNGLGSRGVLWAPWHAQRLAQQILDDEPVPALAF